MDAFTIYIKDWLSSHPFISVASLSKAAGIPPTTLHLNRSIPQKHRYALCWQLAAYGLDINGWRLEQDPLCILRYRAEGEPLEINGSLHTVYEHRCMDDAFDFARFLTEQFPET